MKRITVLLLIALFLVSCSSGSGADIGDEAYNFKVENYLGDTIQLSDFAGKTVFILAWTTT